MHSLDALADPTRRRIVEMLAVRDRAAGEIGRSFEVTASAISQHLKVLRRAKLVTVRTEGRRRIHSINPAGLDQIEAWVTKTKRFWEKQLDALEQALRDEDELKRAKK
jgi:DNA-binding transcriptional ArsR family regulator